MEKAMKQKQKAGIVTLLNDTTLTKVTYGKYATWFPDVVAYGIYEWFSSQENTLLNTIKRTSTPFRLYRAFSMTSPIIHSFKNIKTMMIKMLCSILNLSILVKDWEDLFSFY